MGKLLPPVNKQRQAVLEALQSNPEKFAFFQSVWLLQKHLGPRSAVGTDLRVNEEMLRLGVDNTLGFPKADIASLTKTGENNRGEPRYEISTYFLGLHGTTSPLPAYYNDASIQALPEYNPRREFLDFFHHRSLSLMYRSWKKYRYYLNYRSNASDDWSRWVFSYLGLASNELRQQSGLPWHRMLSYAGLLATRGRSAAVIRGVVAHCFRLDEVRIEQRIERRVRMPELQLNALGQANHQLGNTAHLGATVLDRAGKFRIVLRPKSFEQFRSFLPGEHNYQMLRDLVETVLRDQLSYDIELLLGAEHKPQIALGRRHQCELAGTTWLGKLNSQDENVLIAGRA